MALYGLNRTLGQCRREASVPKAIASPVNPRKNIAKI
ncbi:hypothetical protein SYNPCC7002_A2652 [Picosynechococcus sp. PCC 7002]|nr:hypothetical protein SYNPCC7002_A2652 [Picosynechococcus sp. PCC 7002]